ncbi:hypothetical protein TSOC_002405 [Tetrabaena socialis]|uniref:PsbP C-terminal domain-containing protein n=1 Tax=Tetrabaena socialis TaxID=47790 RepID=A0A2J8AEB5_9CHLO|nr:hypothetical protein TSOC_002405 [Tetrabaena socialis]|eukprot:PNH10865.1 hypothetical protein TSOC_002405 [Tetrabaena socialis]
MARREVMPYVKPHSKAYLRGREGAIAWPARPPGERLGRRVIENAPPGVISAASAAGRSCLSSAVSKAKRRCCRVSAPDMAACGRRGVGGTRGKDVALGREACKHSSVARRELLQLGIALPFLAFQGPASAEVAEAAAPAPASAPEAAAPAASAQLFLEQDFQLTPPLGFKFVDTQPPYDPTRVSSRTRARGGREVVLPPRETLAGLVEIPPKNYYRYELTTNTGLHVVMTAAVQRGRVYVCGGSTAAGERWEQYGSVLREATESFRLRSDNMVL